MEEPFRIAETFSRNSILVVIGVIATVGIGGLALSEHNGTLIAGFCGMTCVSLFGQMQAATKVAEAKADLKADLEVAAVKVEAVKTDLAQAAKGYNGKLDAIHGLVNSKMATQLMRNLKLASALAILAHRYAILSHKDEDVDVALLFDEDVKAAQAEYDEHMAKQAVVDAATMAS